MMKKALALGILLGAGLVSFAFAQTASFIPAPVTLNSAGTPIVTSTYDLNANPATRLIPATGGTKSVAIAFPTTKGGTLMMSPGVNEYVRPDRTEVNISNKPNDFTPIQPACNQVNEISSEINLQWVTRASDQPSWGACILEPNKIYYFNIRYVKADGTTACTQATCGAYMDLPPLGTIAVTANTTTGPTNTPCTTLSKNLAAGSKDATTDGEVTKLQTFLQGKYLSVAPTGYYGNLTVAAVKAFQKDNGISQVGRVGPTTREKIEDLSCGGGTPVALPAASYAPPVAKSTVVQGPSGTGVIQVTSPWEGQRLNNTSTCSGEGCFGAPPITTIRWSGKADEEATIDLYDRSNRKVKTIANDYGTRYVWLYDPSLEDGEYKIVIRTPSGTGSTGYFTIGERTNQTTPDPIVTTCPTGQTLVNGSCRSNQPTVTENTTPCPAVPSKSRTYSREQRSSWWDAQISGTTGVNTVTLGHYKYPETTEVGTFVYYGERCALSATPGTRTCPYTNSIYGSGADVNAYSILIHAPDSSNDPNEVGDRVYTAYKKPIVGYSRYNRAFDISLPFKISASEVGKKFNFQYSVENQNIRQEGQYSISECEGDFSERSIVVGNYGQLVRANVVATNDLEGSKFTPGLANPWLALKTNKVYYLNLRWIKTKAVGAYSGADCIADANNNCLSPFVSTDQIPDSGIHDHALARQIRNGANDDALEFYRWDISQQNDGYFGNGLSTEAQLRTDPLFDAPGGAVLSPGLYYPSCSAGGTVNWGIRGSDCQVRCMTGYVVSNGQCVRQTNAPQGTGNSVQPVTLSPIPVLFHRSDEMQPNPADPTGPYGWTGGGTLANYEAGSGNHEHLNVPQPLINRGPGAVDIPKVNDGQIISYRIPPMNNPWNVDGYTGGVVYLGQTPSSPGGGITNVTISKIPGEISTTGSGPCKSSGQMNVTTSLHWSYTDSTPSVQNNWACYTPDSQGPWYVNIQYTGTNGAPWTCGTIVNGTVVPRQHCGHSVSFNVSGTRTR